MFAYAASPVSNKSFAVVSFGCQMNMRDSSWLAASLKKHGFSESLPENADLIIINTCSVREKPEKKVEATVRRLVGTHNKSSDFMICITGCVAQQLGTDLFKISHKIRLIAGTDQVGAIPGHINYLLANPEEKLVLTSFEKGMIERPDADEKCADGQAFVNIMQGCDNFCAYCIVPFTRGRQKSRLKKDILAECKSFIEKGASEITLLGQNVNAWGKDNHREKFADLLKAVDALPGLKRLRYAVPHPRDMDSESVRMFTDLPTLCPRLHLPLQAGSDRILAHMRRGYTGSEFIDLVARLRSARPDIAISTDLIVGFPGESEADFDQTLRMMEECDFMNSFSFCYSDRPGTRASLMPDKIAKEVKLERLNRLQSLQDKLTFAWLKGRVDETTEIMLEKPAHKNNAEGNIWQGRDPFGMIVNLSVKDGSAGMFVKARITEAKKHSLIGEQIWQVLP